MANHTSTKRGGKPAKPWDGFPLFAHATGRWAKKIRGKFVYFGPWDDPVAAEQKWQDQKEDLLAGRTPRTSADGLTVKELVNKFLAAKRHLVDTRELTLRSWQNYHRSGTTIAEAFGRTRLVLDLAADDFERLRAELAKTRGPVALANEIRHARILFKYAYDAGLIDRPMRVGPHFKVPSRRILRRNRQDAGPRMLQADELRKVLAAAKTPLRAMILLGLNAGFGATDISALPQSAIRGSWIEFPRPKTSIPRRIPLWPETVAAVQEAIAARPAAKDPADAGLCFITRTGQRWVKVSDTEKQSWKDSVTTEFSKLLVELGLKRKGIAFYCLRHGFETVAGEARDQPATDSIMGHAAASDDMGAVYREGISDSRLRAVTDTVRAWLFPKAKRAAKG